MRAGVAELRGSAGGHDRRRPRGAPGGGLEVYAPRPMPRKGKRKIEGLDAELQAAAGGEPLGAFRLPVELEGRSFLDVGCWEGVHCADAVRRGASEVVGIDICTGDGLAANVERYGFEFLQMDVFGEHFRASGASTSSSARACCLRRRARRCCCRLRNVTGELLVVETASRRSAATSR